MNTTSNTNFEERYIGLRRKENRVYSDTEIAQLPEIDVQHQHYKEWMIRKTSAKKLINYLKKKKPIVETTGVFDFLPYERIE